MRATTNLWPKEFQEKYEPIKEVGHGAFGVVVLARTRMRSPAPCVPVASDSTEPQSLSTITTDRTVVIKLVGTTSNPSEVAYARREKDILMQLDHPHIVKCHEYSEPPKSDARRIGMVLSYVKGPSLESLLVYGGALSTSCGTIIITQLVDAISYLHSNGFIHRDIKPENVIVEGADLSQDDIWDNQDDADSEVDRGRVSRRWRAVLVDFGFARRLQASAASHSNPTMLTTIIEERPQELLSSDRESDTSSSGDEPEASEPTSWQVASAQKRKAFHRSMSALGTRRYAAPEIFRKMQRTSKVVTKHRNAAVADEAVLGEYVSSYGVLVDAYALGHMSRYMMTGVPPEQSVAEAVSKQRRPATRILRFVISRSSRDKESKAIRHRHYRSLSEIPSSLRRLIKDLTEPYESKRLSVEEARLDRIGRRIVVQSKCRDP